MIHLWHVFQHWLAVQTGTYIPPGQYSDHYNFLSGAGSDFTEIAILGTVFGVYKHHNCAVRRCPRLAYKHFEVEGTHLKTCHHHATEYWHRVLLEQYQKEHPEQHKLLTKRKGK